MDIMDIAIAKALAGGGGGGGGSSTNFVVNFTVDDIEEDYSPATADKTFAQVKSAFESGQNIIATAYRNSISSLAVFNLVNVEYSDDEIFGFEFAYINVGGDQIMQITLWLYDGDIYSEKYTYPSA